MSKGSLPSGFQPVCVLSLSAAMPPTPPSPIPEPRPTNRGAMLSEKEAVREQLYHGLFLTQGE